MQKKGYTSVQIHKKMSQAMLPLVSEESEYLVIVNAVSVNEPRSILGRSKAH